MDELISFGGAIKALDDSGKVGGYLVRFSDGKSRDLSGEYFDANTYYGARKGDGVDTVFHHAQPLPLKAGLPDAVKGELGKLQEKFFTPVKTRVDTIGIWAETVLNLADEYEKAVYGLVKAGKLGWSSGAVGHLVKKEPSGRIATWPIGEASMTPTPCEPLNRVVTIKSLAEIAYQPMEDEPAPATKAKPDAAHATLVGKINQHIDDLVEDGHTRAHIVAKMAREAGMEVRHLEETLAKDDARPSDANLKAFARVLKISYDVLKSAARRDYAKTVKGMFADAMDSQTPSRWQLESIYCDLVKKMVAAAAGNKIAGQPFDLEAKLKEITSEYTGVLLKHVSMQAQEYLDSGEMDEPFYIKATIQDEEGLKSLSNFDLDDHSQLAVFALRGLASRYRGNHEGRVKAGRVLSERNRTRISNLMQQIKDISAEMERLLEESQPMATDAEKRAAETEYLRLQWRTRQLGVN